MTFNNIHDKVGELEKKGNESREAGNYTEALDLYSKAIAMEKSNKNNSRRIAHLRNEKGLIYYQMKKFVFLFYVFWSKLENLFRLFKESKFNPINRSYILK